MHKILYGTQEINIRSLIYKENYISIYSSIFNVVCINHGVVYKIHGVIYTRPRRDL